MRPRKVVLVVDDDEQNLSVLKFTIETNGLRVISATNGAEAIAIFAQQNVDMVLTDHAMPRMSGDQLVAKLKSMAPWIPMVIMGDPKRVMGVAHGADAFLNKRMTSTLELLERIKIMSARKRGPRKEFRKPIQAEDNICNSAKLVAS